MLDFSDLLAENLPERTNRVLDAIGVSTVEELYSVMWAFPSLATLDEVDFAQLSNAALMCTNMTETRVESNFASAGFNRSNQYPYSLGASGTENSNWNIGTRLSLSEFDDQTDSIPEQLPDIKIGYQVPCDWPVKNQGTRGTCVAFAVSALVEAEMCRQLHTIDFLSEQFLFYVAKTRHCKVAATDGTTISAAKKALELEGICLEDLHPYNSTPSAYPAQHVPSQDAFDDAMDRKRGSYISSANASVSRSVEVAKLLAINGEVAISLPVFADPQNQDDSVNNWNTAVGVSYGVVVNPPPTSVVIGGHAVCIVGFEPDRAEPSGGYFVFRNSWGRDWGSDLPNSTISRASEPGYGQISASYLNRFLWEAMRI